MARLLNPEEAELWARVTASIRPLSREPVEATSTPAAAQPTPPPLEAKPKGPPPRRAPPPEPRRATPGTTLDGTWDRKLRSGSVQPDRIVDLHGHTLDSAWHEIDVALERAEAAGNRVILLVTGHHRPGEPPVR